MLKLSVGGGLFVMEAAISSFSLPPDASPSALWTALIYTAVGAIPLIDQLSNGLIAGSVQSLADDANTV